MVAEVAATGPDTQLAPAGFMLLATWQGAAIVGPSTLPDIEALARFVAACPRLASARIMRPVDAYDPYCESVPEPALAVELRFTQRAHLMALFREQGYVRSLLQLGIQVGERAELDAMSIYRAPGTFPRIGRFTTYWVEYQGPAKDPALWHKAYLASHPTLVSSLPGAQSVEVFLPMEVEVERFAPQRRCLQRNSVTFDTPGALNAALQSDVRHRMRADFASLPPYAGNVIHTAMMTRAPLGAVHQ